MAVVAEVESGDIPQSLLLLLFLFYINVLSCSDTGDVEHTHLVKGLDYALLNKVRSEIDKKPDAGYDAEGRAR